MYSSVRQPVVAGFALVGAAVVAVSAAQPMPQVHHPDFHLPAMWVSELHLSAFVNPLDVYARVFNDALNNVGVLASTARPGEVLNQIIANQLGSAGQLASALQASGGAVAGVLATVPATLSTAASQLAAGDLSGAANTLLGIPVSVLLPVTKLLPAVQDALTRPMQNIINVIAAFTADPLTTLLKVAGLVAPIISGISATATAVQHVLDAIGKGDLAAAANAVIMAPATIADGFLNGGYGPDLAPLVGIDVGFPVKAGGLLSTGGGFVTDSDGNLALGIGGPLYSIQQILDTVKNAITPPAATSTVVLTRNATTDIAAIPASSGGTLTLTTGSSPMEPEPGGTGAVDTPGTPPRAAGPESTADAASVDEFTDLPTTANASAAMPSTSFATPPSVKVVDGDLATGTVRATVPTTSVPKVDIPRPSSSRAPATASPAMTDGNKVEPAKTTSAGGPAGGSAASATDTTTTTPAGDAAAKTTGDSSNGASDKTDSTK